MQNLLLVFIPETEFRKDYESSNPGIIKIAKLILDAVYF